MIPEALRTEISGLAATALGLKVVDHQRNIPGQDTAGGLTDDWRSIGTFQGRLRQAKKVYDQTLGGLIQSGADWELCLSVSEAARVDVRWGDRVVVGGSTYGIVGGDKDRTDGWTVVYQATQIQNR